MSGAGEAQTAHVPRSLKGLPVTIDGAEEEDVLLRLVRQLTLYDAAYLELAVRRRLPLATVDSALGLAARAESVPLLGGSAG